MIGVKECMETSTGAGLCAGAPAIMASIYPAMAS